MAEEIPSEIEDDIISNTPSPVSSETSHEQPKVNHTTIVYNIHNINAVVYYPEAQLTRQIHHSTRRNNGPHQVDVHVFRMICEITELKNKRFRFHNIRTVGIYNIFKMSDHLKDDVTGHRIEIDFTNQLYNKIPQLSSKIMIMGCIKYKPVIKDNIKNYMPYIEVKTWETWTGKINFQEFYYNVKRYRNSAVEETIPIDEAESESDNMPDSDDLERTEFLNNLEKEEMNLDNSNCNMSTNEDFEKTEFLNNIESEERVVFESIVSVDEVENSYVIENYFDPIIIDSDESDL